MNTSQNISLWSNIFKRAAPWGKRVALLWSETPLFNNIPKREIALLSRNMHSRHYNVGEYIFHTGDEGAGAAIILNGKIEIKAGDVVLATLKEGDFFGEISLVLDERRTADAIAVEDTELVFFLRPELERWIKRAPQQGAKLGTNLAHILAKRLSHANEMLAEKE